MTTFLSSANILSEIEQRAEKAGSLEALAKELDFTPSFLSHVLAGRRDVTDALAKSLGFERADAWRRRRSPTGAERA